jgi:hypothetical protein
LTSVSKKEFHPASFMRTRMAPRFSSFIGFYFCSLSQVGTTSRSFSTFQTRCLQNRSCPDGSARFKVLVLDILFSATTHSLSLSVVYMLQLLSLPLQRILIKFWASLKMPPPRRSRRSIFLYVAFYRALVQSNSFPLACPEVSPGHKPRQGRTRQVRRNPGSI